MSAPKPNKTPTGGDWFYYVLTDDRSDEVLELLIERFQAEDLIGNDPVVLRAKAREWALTPEALGDIFFDACAMSETAMSVHFPLAWKAMGDFAANMFDGVAADMYQEDFWHTSAEEFAKNVAGDLVDDDGCDRSDCVLAVVHMDTVREVSIVGLVDEIRQEQERRGRTPLRVFVHDGTVASLRE